MGRRLRSLSDIRHGQIALSSGRRDAHIGLLPGELFADACERETQLGIRPRPNLGGDGIGLHERDTCGIRNAGEMLRFGAVAKLDAKA